MPHVTFVHGIANKPKSEALLHNWISALAEGGLDLQSEGVTSSMTYWADVMYAEPLSDENAFEAVASNLGTSESDSTLPSTEGLPSEEAIFLESLRAKLGVDAPAPGGDERFSPNTPQDEDGAASFEAVPLPWFIKKRVMKRLLKDVYYYLFNKSFSPRPGEEYRVRDTIRERFVNQLSDDAAANTDGKHVVVSHSMGTVISYDCLKHVPSCPAVDAYMTVGSPLGISEVHDKFETRYTPQSAFPAEKVRGGWTNVYDRLDPVAFDAQLANDYLRNGDRVVQDERVRNSGRWRHSSWKYYGQDKLTSTLRRYLEL